MSLLRNKTLVPSREREERTIGRLIELEQGNRQFGRRDKRLKMENAERYIGKRERIRGGKNLTHSRPFQGVFHRCSWFQAVMKPYITQSQYYDIMSLCDMRWLCLPKFFHNYQAKSITLSLGISQRALGQLFPKPPLACLLSNRNYKLLNDTSRLKTGGVAQSVECLSSSPKVLGLIPTRGLVALHYDASI